MASERYTHSVQFLARYGSFFVGWAVAEAAIDCAIGRFLRLSHHETHILTAGMLHGRKCMLLQQLVKASSHPKKSELLRNLRIIQNESMRNTFANSYIASDKNSVSFIERSTGGSYSAEERTFNPEDFSSLIEKFIISTAEFSQAMDFEELELECFQDAALSTRQSRKTT